MSESEKKIVDLVLAPDAGEVWEIASRALSNKHNVFREMGWGENLNHQINQGDVRCVLEAIRQMAGVNVAGDQP